MLNTITPGISAEKPLEGSKQIQELEIKYTGHSDWQEDFDNDDITTLINLYPDYSLTNQSAADSLSVFIGMRNRFGDFSLTHAVAIFDYVRNGSASLNKSLREEVVDETTNRKAANLNGALSFLPAYQGEVYRGVDRLIQEYKIGSVVLEKQFLSCSKNVNGVLNGNVRFIIKSINGRELGNLNPTGEEEVLFPSGTAFKVTGVKSGDFIEIRMEEVEVK